jgi:hypothetical protein
MASIIIFSTLWGLGFKEWRGTGVAAMRLLGLALFLLGRINSDRGLWEFPSGLIRTLTVLMSSRKTAFSSREVVNISDLRRLAQRRLPRAVFDCLDGAQTPSLHSARIARHWTKSTFALVPRLPSKMPTSESASWDTSSNFPSFSLQSDTADWLSIAPSRPRGDYRHSPVGPALRAAPKILRRR